MERGFQASAPPEKHCSLLFRKVKSSENKRRSETDPILIEHLSRIIEPLTLRELGEIQIEGRRSGKDCKREKVISVLRMKELTRS